MVPRLAALWLASLGLSLVACSSTPTDTCAALHCGGCCDSTGRCRQGNEAGACGIGGAACTSCSGTQTCSAQGACVASTSCGGCVDGTGVCQPGTASSACGANGAACTACGSGSACENGRCTSSCTPQCSGKQCGPDGCNGSCGTCASGSSCDANGQCAACTPQCSGKQCGPDGCNGSCGTCSGGSSCDANGQCQACTPQCSGKQCGPDGCNGSCGTCATGTCNANGQCVTSCTPQCSGKQCGPDGCNGSCGTCSPGTSCNVSGQCVAATCAGYNAQLEAACVPTGGAWGNGMSAVFGRIDGTITAVATPGSSGCDQSNNTHLVIEVTMGGAEYPLVVNIDDTQNPPTNDVYFGETDHALVGVPWQDGWHTDTGELLDYVNNLGVHSTAFQPFSPSTLVNNVVCELVPGDQVSIYALGWGTNGGHDIHRNTGGGGADGAVVVHANTSSPHYMMFRFVNQSF